VEGYCRAEKGLKFKVLISSSANALSWERLFWTFAVNQDYLWLPFLVLTTSLFLFSKHKVVCIQV